MLSDIVAERADRVQHALVADSTTDSCGRGTYQNSISVVSCRNFHKTCLFRTAF
jgi:hypothetical protein